MFKYIIWLTKILFLIFSIFFFLKVDFEKIDLFNANQIFVLSVLYIFHIFRIFRLFLIFKIMKQKIKIKQVIDIYYIGIYLGIVTPGRLGELYRFKMINDIGIPKTSNFNIMLAEKLTDIISLLFFLSLIFFINFNHVSISVVYSSFLIILICLLSIIGYNFFLKILENILSKFKFSKNNKTINLFYNNNPFFILDLKKFIILSSTTILIWLLFIYATQIGININFEISFLITMKYFITNTLITAIPISIMGLGIREVALIEILGIQNLELIAVISLQFIILNGATIIPGMLLYVKKEI